jgi:hypothetical protein
VSYSDFVEEHVRISALRLLKEVPDGRLNESVLREGLTQLGFARSRAQMRVTLEWLKDAGLIKHEWFGETVLVAALTERGLDVAEGREIVKGVHRPSPA